MYWFGGFLHQIRERKVKFMIGYKGYKWSGLDSYSRDYPMFSIFRHQAYKDSLSFPQSIVQDLCAYMDSKPKNFFCIYCKHIIS